MFEECVLRLTKVGSYTVPVHLPAWAIFHEHLTQN